MIVLLHLHRKYAEIMEEAGCLADFEKLIGVLENIHEARDLIDGMVKVWEATQSSRLSAAELENTSHQPSSATTWQIQQTS